MCQAAMCKCGAEGVAKETGKLEKGYAQSLPGDSADHRYRIDPPGHFYCKTQHLREDIRLSSMAAPNTTQAGPKPGNDTLMTWRVPAVITPKAMRPALLLAKARPSPVQ